MLCILNVYSHIAHKIKPQGVSKKTADMTQLLSSDFCMYVATLEEKQYLLSVELADIGPPCHLLYIIPFPNHSGYGIQTGSG